MTTLSKDQNTGMWLYGAFAFERGVGICVAGPVSGLLVGKGGEGVEGYGTLILFVGGAFAISCVAGLGWVFVKRDESKGRWWKREGRAKSEQSGDAESR